MGRLNLLTSRRERPPCNIPNTFAPRVENDFLSINQVIMGLQFGVIEAKNLPDEVRAQLPKPHYNSDEDSYPYPIKSKAHKNGKTGDGAKEQRTTHRKADSF